ncbi:hypothetical protein TNCV_271091 [Trichonephila clavipes]|nr:hypothetical protein TNCV_271091 [Trichonephila clavipes]
MYSCVVSMHADFIVVSDGKVIDPDVEERGRNKQPCEAAAKIILVLEKSPRDYDRFKTEGAQVESSFIGDPERAKEPQQSWHHLSTTKATKPSDT